MTTRHQRVRPDQRARPANAETSRSVPRQHSTSRVPVSMAPAQHPHSRQAPTYQDQIATIPESQGRTSELPLPANWIVVSRAVALFLGILTLLTVLGEKRPPARPAQFGWIDLTPCPADLASGLLAFSGLLLLFYALARKWHGWMPLLTTTTAVLLMTISLRDAFVFLRDVKQGAIATTAFVPFSLHVAAYYAVVAAGARKTRYAITPIQIDKSILWGGFSFVACAACFIVAQIYCVGKVDQTQKADVIVVFACENQQNRSLTNQEIQQRWQQAVQLHEKGVAQNLLIVASSTTDANVWNQLARQSSISSQHIQTKLLSNGDLQRAATVIRQELQTNNWNDALVVTHFYQMPRLKMCFWRLNQPILAAPVNDPAWPADGQQLLRSEIRALTREYTRPLWGSADET